MHVELSVIVTGDDDHVPTIEVPPPPPPPGPVGPAGVFGVFGVFGTFDGSMYAGSLLRTNSHPDAINTDAVNARMNRAVLVVMTVLWTAGSGRPNWVELKACPAETGAKTGDRPPGAHGCDRQISDSGGVLILSARRRVANRFHKVPHERP